MNAREAIQKAVRDKLHPEPPKVIVIREKEVVERVVYRDKPEPPSPPEVPFDLWESVKMWAEIAVWLVLLFLFFLLVTAISFLLFGDLSTKETRWNGIIGLAAAMVLGWVWIERDWRLW